MKAAAQLNMRTLLMSEADEKAKAMISGFDANWLDWRAVDAETITYLREADVIVIDSYLVDHENLLKLRKNTRGTCKIFYLDDYSRLDYPGDGILNYSIGASLSMFANQTEIKSYFIGPAYAPLHEVFSTARGVKRSVRDELSSVLITFGGADLQQYCRQTLEVLYDTFRGLKMEVILGHQSGIDEKTFANDDRVTIHKFLSPQKLKLLIESCDLCITASGHTTYEIAALAVPMIVVQTAENQRINLAGWKAAGVPTVNPAETIFEKAISAFVHFFSDLQARVRYSDSITGTVRADGALHFMKSALSL